MEKTSGRGGERITPLDLLIPKYNNVFMETIGSSEVLQRYESLKALATEHMKVRVDDNKNPELREKYPYMFMGSENGKNYDLQLTDPMKNNPSNVLDIDGNSVKVLARLWITSKGEVKGNGMAICINLGEDGNWYKQESDTYTVDQEKDTTFWTMGKVDKVTPISKDFFVDKAISRLQKPEVKN